MANLPQRVGSPQRSGRQTLESEFLTSEFLTLSEFLTSANGRKSHFKEWMVEGESSFAIPRSGLSRVRVRVRVRFRRLNRRVG